MAWQARGKRAAGSGSYVRAGDEQAAIWRDRRGRVARWPDLVEATSLMSIHVVLAAAHLDGDPRNIAWPISGASASGVTCCTTARPTSPATLHHPQAVACAR